MAATERSPRALALALVSIMMLAAVPVSEAGEPRPVAWSGYRAAEAVKAFALAKDAGTLAVGLASVSDRGVGAPDLSGGTAVATSDLLVFNLNDGRLFNSTSTLAGRRAAATSSDGKVVVAAGPAGPSLNGEVLSFYRVAGAAPPPPGGSEPGQQAPAWTENLGAPVNALATSGNGKRIAVAVSASSGPRLVVYNDEKANLMSFTGADRIGSVAMSKDGEWVVAGGRVRSDDQVAGAVFLFRATSSEPQKRFVLSSENATEIVSVAMTPDGSAFAALTVGGQVLTFTNEGLRTRDPLAHGASAANVTGRALALSANGRFVAFAADRSVTLLERSSTSLSARWTFAAPDVVHALDMDRTGSILVAAVAGATGGVFGFSPLASEPFWRLTGGGGASHVALTWDGAHVAYAQGRVVHARSLPHNLTFLFETGPGQGTPLAPPAATLPFKPVTFSAIVRNDGARPERVELELPSIREMTVAANRTSFDVLPGQSQRVALTVTPGRLPPGPYAANVTARAVGAGHWANLTLNVTVSPVSDISLALSGPPERRLAPGGNDSLLLGVTNDGNGATEVQVDVTQRVTKGGEWQVRLVGGSRFPLAPGASGTIRILVNVPEDAVNGSSNKLTVSVRSPAGTSSQDVLYHVNPFVAVNVTAAGRTKFVYSGETAQFNLTVRNTGSVAAQFEAAYNPPRVTGLSRNWVVDMDIAPFPLEPGASRVLPVRVFAPEDAAKDDLLSVTVEVANVPLNSGMKIVSENITLVAYVTDPPPAPPSSEGRVPAPGALLGALAVACAAFLLSRRRSL